MRAISVANYYWTLWWVRIVSLRWLHLFLTEINPIFSESSNGLCLPVSHPVWSSNQTFMGHFSSHRIGPPAISEIINNILSIGFIRSFHIRAHVRRFQLETRVNRTEPKWCNLCWGSNEFAAKKTNEQHTIPRASVQLWSWEKRHNFVNYVSDDHFWIGRPKLVAPPSFAFGFKPVWIAGVLRWTMESREPPTTPWASSCFLYCRTRGRFQCSAGSKPGRRCYHREPFFHSSRYKASVSLPPKRERERSAPKMDHHSSRSCYPLPRKLFARTQPWRRLENALEKEKKGLDAPVAIKSATEVTNELVISFSW